MMNQQIESTGHIMTIGQREHEARRHIVNTLATTEQRLWTLNEQEAARHVQAAIDSLKTSIRTRKERNDVSRT